MFVALGDIDARGVTEAADALDVGADGFMIVFPLSDGHLVADALGHQGADGADRDALVARCEAHDVEVRRIRKGERTLVFIRDVDGNLFLASRNVPNLYALDVASLDPVSLVAADKVVMTRAAVEKIQEWLA